MQTKNQKILFEQLVQQNKGLFFKVAKMYCRNEDDRQDLLQEILIQVWQHFPKYNPQFALSTWLYRIALNVAISFHRKKVVREGNFISLNEDFYQLPMLESSEKEQQLSLLEKFIDELKELDKALILLYLEDKSQNEIADILGLSVSNVSTKVGRIKEKLRQRFSEQNF